MMPPAIEHTPPPWYVHPESLVECDGVCVEAMTPDGKMVTREVCSLMIDGDTPHERAEDVGNARLIAATPVMYAILRRLVVAKTAMEAAVVMGDAERLLDGLQGGRTKHTTRR